MATAPNQSSPKVRQFIGLRDLTDAGKLAAKRLETENLRGLLKREWALNREYYNGNQWAVWNDVMRRIENTPANSGPAWRVRLQSNQIKPGLSSYVAQVHKTRPVIYAEPDSNGDTDIKAAQMASFLFEYWWDELGLASKAPAAQVEAGLSGGFWDIGWDALAGKPMTFVMDPNGQPILDDELAELFLDELEQRVGQQAQQMGQDPQQAVEMVKQQAVQTVYVGDIDVRVKMAEDVLLDPSAADFEDCKWAIVRHRLDPDEIQARWGVKVQPNADKGTDIPLRFSALEERKPQMATRTVFCMYIRPCPALPDGRYVAWIEGPNQILQDIKWPWKHRLIPLVKFPGNYRPDSPYDDPVTTEARPLQKDFNQTLSQIVTHKNLTLRPQLLAAKGSLRTKLTTEPGAVFEYNIVGNAPPPQWREMPNIPPYIFEQMQSLQAGIDRVYNRIPSNRDQIPARADGGALLEAMQEATADQISTVILRLEDSLARAGEIMISLAKQYYDEPRLLKIRGTGGSVQVKKFEAADIDGGFAFRPKYGTGLPRTRQGKQDAIMQLLQAQLIDPPTAMKHLDLGDLKGVQAKIQQDEEQALREHDKMLRGIPINVPAAQQAQQALAMFQDQANQIMAQLQNGQPVDLDGDGQPDQPQQVVQELQQQFQQLQQQAQDAPWQPLDYENWQAHIDEHGMLMKSVEFEGYPPQVQAIFIQHFNLTYQRMIDVMMASPDQTATPKINVRAMGTVSAPVMAKLLAKAGVSVTEDEVSEPALDTQVIDSLNEPKVDASGDDPLSQVDQTLTMMHAQDQHELSQAQTMQAMGQSEANQGNQEDAHQQQMQHAQETHDAKMAQMQQTHEQRMKASQSSANKQNSNAKGK